MQHVAIFGCPRSGTSWLGQIFNSAPGVLYRYQPLFSYEFKDWFGRHGLNELTLAGFHAALRDASSDFVLQALRPTKSTPTHLIWKEVRYHQHMPALLSLRGLRHMVYMFRPALDVINSWYLAPREFRAGQDIHAEYLDAPSKNTDTCEFNGLNRWKASMRQALALRERHPGRLLLLSYDRLRDDPPAQTQALFDTIGLPLGGATRAFVQQSTSRRETDAYSVFRAGRTPIELPVAIVQALRADPEVHELLQRAEAAALSCEGLQSTTV